jgi:hypothetical protein
MHRTMVCGTLSHGSTRYILVPGALYNVDWIYRIIIYYVALSTVHRQDNTVVYWNKEVGFQSTMVEKRPLVPVCKAHWSRLEQL